jgi:hypothetical protein
MDRISDEERRRIAELLAEGAPVWRLHREINRSRYAIRRAVIASAGGLGWPSFGVSARTPEVPDGHHDPIRCPHPGSRPSLPTRNGWH